MGKKWWLSRTAGGIVAGVVMAGAGAGVAVAGAAGNSDQYTPGAKPYAGVQPHNITVGTTTYTSSATLSVPAETVDVTTPYATETAIAQILAAIAKEEAAVAANNAAQIKVQAAQISALMKGSLRPLLAPTGAYLQTSKLSASKKLSFAFVSPGTGTLKVVWKLSVPGKKSVNLVSLSGGLHKLGDTRVNLPLTIAGRNLLKSAKSASISAVATYTVSGATVSVSKVYKLKG